MKKERIEKKESRRERKEKKPMNPKFIKWSKIILYVVLVGISFQLSEKIAMNFIELLKQIINYGVVELTKIFFAMLIAIYTYFIFKK